MKRLSILFVGNSYTYYNDMPSTYFTECAIENGYSPEVVAITAGGYRLSQFADPENEQGKRLREAIGGRHFDFAILQEQSVNPIVNEAEFLSGVEGVKSLVDADRFLLYATWGRNEGSEKLEELGLTREEMTERLSAAYNKAASCFGMSVAEVGRAFLSYSEDKGRDDLYDPDRSHPSRKGSEVAARVIFERILELINR